jgi:hypothetical protein
VAKMTSQDKATCKAYFKHLDRLSERRKPIPCEDESQIHLESTSDTQHELSEDILISNNLTSTPLVLSSSLLGCSDNETSFP